MAGDEEAVLGPEDGERVQIGGLGVRFMIDGERSGGGFALVEHPIAPKHLAAPLHRHSREDEYSFVLEGTVGFELGGRVITAGPGELVFKPRGEAHAFWNAGDEPCRLLEIVAPGGFERFFEELGEATAAGPPSDELMGELSARYGIEFDMEGTARVVAEHGLTFPPLEAMAQ